ncbi:MAG: PQQ-binding-like beta-propeller repeat protein [Verrucomicrobiota bacterium]
MSLAAFGLEMGGALAAAETTPQTKSARAAELVASAEKGWPQFRGARRDGVSDERGLLQAWPESGPKVLWTADGAGNGYSSPIVAGGKIFVTGDVDGTLWVVAYDLQGNQLWRMKHGDAWLNQYQGARASVTFSEGHLYLQNAHGRVACFVAETGKEVWAVNVLERFRSENITWGIAECLAVDERAVYVTPGGPETLVAALDKRTGEVLWKTEALKAAEGKVDGPGYAAPILVRFEGRRLLIGASSGHLYCVDLEGRRIAWSRPRPTNYGVLAMSPVLAGDGIFMTAPFGPPGEMVRLVAPKGSGGNESGKEKENVSGKGNGSVSVEPVWTTKLDTAQGGVVYAEGRLYGSYYPRRGGWAALDAKTGKVLYEAPDFVKGAPMWADGRLYALCEDGWMLLLEPTATEFTVRGKFRLANARDRNAWAHPVIVEGRMYLRYQGVVTCYEVRVGAGE